MFSVHDFIMETLHGMVGHYPDFQVREYALNWYGKGKLNEDDLAIVETWLNPTPVEETEPEGEEAPEEESEEQETEHDPLGNYVLL